MSSRQSYGIDMERQVGLLVLLRWIEDIGQLAFAQPDGISQHQWPGGCQSGEASGFAGVARIMALNML
jgi:hypothetical protein